MPSSRLCDLWCALPRVGLDIVHVNAAQKVSIAPCNDKDIFVLKIGQGRVNSRRGRFGQSFAYYPGAFGKARVLAPFGWVVIVFKAENRRVDLNRVIVEQVN